MDKRTKAIPRLALAQIAPPIVRLRLAEDAALKLQQMKPPCTIAHNKDMNKHGGSTANETKNIKLSNYNKLIFKLLN